MHKEELKDAVKDLFGNFTEGEFLRYFTSKFPRLLVHCYNAVEKEARDLLAEYFHEDASAQAPTAAIGIPGLELEGSKLTINCNFVITFPEKKIESNTLKIENISHLFIEQNKSFTNFLQKNASNITKLDFNKGSFKFDSMNKCLRKLPNLKEIEFVGVEYEAPKTNQTIQPTTCHNLVEFKLDARSSNLVQAFQECQTIKKLTLHPQVTLEEILQKYPSLEELGVEVNANYPSSDRHKANSGIHQLKILIITLWTNDEEIHEQLISAILKLNNLEVFHFNNETSYRPSKSFCQQLAAHICQLEHLTRLRTKDGKLLEEVEAFATKSSVANTCLEVFTSDLRYFKLSFFEHFTNMRELDIDCKAEVTKVEDLITSMNKSQLTSIRLWHLPPACFQLLKQLQVGSLQVLEVHIYDRTQEEVPAFDILQEFLPKHPNIIRLVLTFWYNYDEPKSLELIPMILATLTSLEVLIIDNCFKITRDVIEQIAALKTLKHWMINGHNSENFYNTTN